MEDKVTEIVSAWAGTLNWISQNHGAAAPHLAGLATEDLDALAQDVISLIEAAQTSGSVKKFDRVRTIALSNQLLSAIKNVPGNAQNVTALINKLYAVRESIGSFVRSAETRVWLEDHATEELSIKYGEFKRIHYDAELVSKQIGSAEASISAFDKERERAERSLASALDVTSKITEQKAACDTNAGAISALLSQSQANSGEISSLLQSATDIDAENRRLSIDLSAALEQSRALEKKLESLLPGATSIGLAKSWGDNGRKYGAPVLLWALLFSASIVAISVISVLLSGDVAQYVAAGKYDELWKILLFVKLPLAAPLVWLAWFSARQYGHAVRLREDYAYKEAMSLAFEGFKKQMQSIDQELSKKLSDEMISVLSQNPIRIMESRSGDEHPFASFMGSYLASRRKAEVQ